MSRRCRWSGGAGLFAKFLTDNRITFKLVVNASQMFLNPCELGKLYVYKLNCEFLFSYLRLYPL